MNRSAIFNSLRLAGLLALVLGCSSAPLGTEPSGLPLGALSGPPAIVRCDLQTYVSKVAIIGPAGGKLHAGKHEFNIPAGALSAPVQIKMEAVADTVHSVRFSPAGLTFSSLHPPVLKLSMDGCHVPKGYKSKVAYVTESLNIIQVLTSVTDSLNGSTDAHLQHFSRYAVAW